MHDAPCVQYTVTPAMTDITCPQCLEFVSRAWPHSQFDEAKLAIDSTGKIICLKCDAQYGGMHDVFRDYTNRIKDLLDDLNWHESSLKESQSAPRTAA